MPRKKKIDSKKDPKDPKEIKEIKEDIDGTEVVMKTVYDTEEDLDNDLENEHHDHTHVPQIKMHVSMPDDLEEAMIEEAVTERRRNHVDVHLLGFLAVSVSIIFAMAISLVEHSYLLLVWQSIALCFWAVARSRQTELHRKELAMSRMAEHFKEIPKVLSEVIDRINEEVVRKFTKDIHSSKSSDKFPTA